MFFSMICPKMGTLMTNKSQPARPALNFRTSLMNSQTLIGPNGIVNHQFTIQFDMLMRYCVIAGSVASKSSKIFTNAGTILYMMKTKMPTATQMTTIG